MIAISSAEEVLLSLRGRNYAEEVFVLLNGFIDESISGEGVPLTFGLSCVYATGWEWPWIEMAWEKVIEEKNAELSAAGRKPLSRFHAADLSSFTEDFEGWDGDERTAFTSKLIRKVFMRHHVFQSGYTVSLKDVAETWPNYASKTRNFAYYALTKIVMMDLAVWIPKIFLSSTKLSLIHDRCAYDGVILEAFNSLKSNPNFIGRHIFTTIAPMGWEDCALLQVADFVAYEVMKESHRLEPDVVREKERDRRKSLTALLDAEYFYGKAEHVTREALVNIRTSVSDRLARRIAEADEK